MLGLKLNHVSKRGHKPLFKIRANSVSFGPVWARMIEIQIKWNNIHYEMHVQFRPSCFFCKWEFGWVFYNATISTHPRLLCTLLLISVKRTGISRLIMLILWLLLDYSNMHNFDIIAWSMNRISGLVHAKIEILSHCYLNYSGSNSAAAMCKYMKCLWNTMFS